MKDWVILVPDKNTQFVLNGLLPRYQALRIRPLEYDIFIHPQRDPGVYGHASTFLRPFHRQYDFALVFLDREGSGQEDKTSQEIRKHIQGGLNRNGWRGRSDVVVFDPELEIWAWVDSPHLSNSLGWQNLSSLQEFIKRRGFWTENELKPHRPKESVEAALREKGIQKSSAIYEKVAVNASFSNCEEPSFLQFKSDLVQWFTESR